MKTPTGNNAFTGLRAIFWPIHNWELKKFLPLTLMMISILFDYSVLRSVKDSLVVPVCGAEIISSLKLFAVLPSALLFLVVYSKLANVLSKPNLFYTIVLAFLGYFALFALFLYPNHKMLHPDVTSWVAEYPRLKWIILIAGNWTFASFYVMAELWGSVLLTLLFWQFANDITPVTEAKRFYSMFGLLGNLALLMSGPFIMKFSKVDPASTGGDTFASTVNWLVGAIVFFGLVAVLAYGWMQKNVLTDPRYYDPEKINAGKSGKKKVKLSLGESFKYIVTSKYLGCIALLVFGYGVSINLVEGVWKAQLKEQFSSANAYSGFMGEFQIYTGIATMLGMLIGTNIIRIFGWFVGAIITPLMILVTGLAFFAFVVFKGQLEPMIAAVGMTSLSLAVFFGQLQNILSKGTKYSLFDSTKEMSYIPLDDELKVKGKAAVDVVGGRFGKSGGATIQAALLAIFPGSTLVSLTPTISVMFIIILVVWMMAVVALGKMFSEAASNVDSKVKI